MLNIQFLISLYSVLESSSCECANVVIRNETHRHEFEEKF